MNDKIPLLSEILTESPTDSPIFDKPGLRQIKNYRNMRNMLDQMNDEEFNLFASIVNDPAYLNIVDYHKRAEKRLGSANANKIVNRKLDFANFVNKKIEDPDLADAFSTILSDPSAELLQSNYAKRLLRIPKTSKPLPDRRMSPLDRYVSGRKSSHVTRNKVKIHISDWARDTKIKNPETGREIRVATALKKGPEHPAYKAAIKLYKQTFDKKKNNKTLSAENPSGTNSTQ